MVLTAIVLYPLFMPEPKTTPKQIVEDDGHVNVGWFTTPFENANLAEAPARHPLERLRSTPLGRLERAAKRVQLKQWMYASVVTERTLLACAIADLGYVGSSFAYVVDRRTGKKYEYSTLSPGAFGIGVSYNSLRGASCIDKGNFGRAVVLNDSDNGRRRIDLALRGKLGKNPKPPLRASIEIEDNGVDPAPIVVVEESEPGCYLYTHKNYGLSASGRIQCGPIVDAFEMGEGLAGFDFNRGYRPRETYWNWAAASGWSEDGERLGFNLTAHRPWDVASGTNEQDALDCAIWLPDGCQKLDRVEFEYQPGDLMAPWRIRDADGLVDLHFQPEGKRAEDVNFGFVVSQFHQPYGRFSGVLRSRNGKAYALGDVFGVTEQHFARW
jgi:hypothetical protein